MVVELADTTDLKSVAHASVRVRVPPMVPVECEHSSRKIFLCFEQLIRER